MPSVREIAAALAFAALAYLGLCALLFVFQRSMIYLPHAGLAAGSAHLIKRDSPAGTLWMTARERPGDRALIYFGGNAEDVSMNLSAFARAFPDHALYLLHYRGYGGRPGRPSEAAMFEDALAAFDLVHARHPQTAVLGRSLGSAPAVHLAARRPVARLLLVTPFDSLVDLAAHHYPIFPVRWLMRDRYDSSRDAAAVQAPTLLIAAESDEIVPRASTERLLARFAAGVASLKIVPRTGHNTLDGRTEYLEWLKAAL